MLLQKELVLIHAKLDYLLTHRYAAMEGGGSSTEQHRHTTNPSPEGGLTPTVKAFVHKVYWLLLLRCHPTATVPPQLTTMHTQPTDIKYHHM